MKKFTITVNETDKGTVVFLDDTYDGVVEKAKEQFVEIENWIPSYDNIKDFTSYCSTCETDVLEVKFQMI